MEGQEHPSSRSQGLLGSLREEVVKMEGRAGSILCQASGASRQI